MHAPCHYRYENVSCCIGLLSGETLENWMCSAAPAQKHAKTEKQVKKERAFPQRKFAVKA